MKKRILSLLLAGLSTAALGLSTAEGATTWTVNSVNDVTDGVCDATHCSLREAVEQVSSAGDTIVFDPALNGQIISVDDNPIFIDRNLSIIGPGAGNLTVRHNPASFANSVFYVSTGRTVAIERLTISDGSANDGGALANSGILTIRACTIRGNTGQRGGGISNIPLGATATLTVEDCTISDNHVGDGGGGIINNGNTGDATLIVRNSTFSGNSAQSGGGIFNFCGSHTVSATISNCTFSGNYDTDGEGGGILNGGNFTGGTATMHIGNTILKAGANGANIFIRDGTVISDGYNLSSDSGAGVLIATADQINTDPLLGPLADNGGPTFTHAPNVGSPAIDKGKAFG